MTPQEFYERLDAERGEMSWAAFVREFDDLTGKDLAYLIKYYGKVPNAELAKTLNRSVKAIEGKASRLGLRRPIDRSFLDNIKALADEGLYLNQIARKLHCGHTKIVYYENTYGFKVPREPEGARAERVKNNMASFWSRGDVHYTGRF